MHVIHSFYKGLQDTSILSPLSLQHVVDSKGVEGGSLSMINYVTSQGLRFLI